MSQSGYTPIQLYRTTTAAATPSAGNLAAGELAINLTDEKLYFKNAAGTVKLLASTDTLGTVTSVAVSGGTTGLTTSGGPITTSGTITLAGTLGVANGGTGTATAFTAGSVVFAGASGVYTQDNANLFWDNTNDRLGIGTATPGTKLDVQGATPFIRVKENTTGYLGLRAENDSGNFYFGIDSSTGSFFGSAYTRAVYADGAYPMAFYTNATERMRIDASGNVGIGITNPQQLLALGNSTDQVGAGVSGAVSTVYFGSPTNIVGGMKRISYDRATGNLNFIDGSLASPTTQMAINSGGNVGIGTSSPATRLHVASTSDGEIFRVQRLGGTNLTLLRVNMNETNNTGTIDVTAAAGNPAMVFATASTERMRITSTGNVGIGTTAPQGLLQVVAGTDNSLIFRGPITYATGGSIFAVNSANSAVTPMEFAASVFFFSAGNVGVGTSTPSQKLEVGGGGNMLLTGASTGDQFIRVGSGRTGNGYSFIDLQGDTTYSSGLRLIRTNGGANTSSNIEHYGTGELQLITQQAGPITFLTNAIERGRISSDGQFRWGTTTTIDTVSFLPFQVTNGISINTTTTSPASAMSFFNGQGSGTRVGWIGTDGSSTTYNTSSDERLKDNIADADDAASIVDGIQVRQFDWKVNGEHQRYGMIAQELDTVFPEAVSNGPNEDDLLSVDYSKLVPMLVKEIQSLRARVAQLEGN